MHNPNQKKKYPLIEDIVKNYQAILKKQNYKFETSNNLSKIMQLLARYMYGNRNNHLKNNFTID